MIEVFFGPLISEKKVSVKDNGRQTMDDDTTNDGRRRWRTPSYEKTLLSYQQNTQL